MRFATIAAALLAAMVARDAGAPTVEAVGGTAWTRMADVNWGDLLGPSIRQGTIGLRTGFPMAHRLALVADVRLVPRGGGVQYRQTYGYYGDYLELSPRASWHLGERLSRLGFSLGPTVAFRLRQRNSASIYAYEPQPFQEEYGPLSKTDLGLLGTVGYTAMTRRRVRVTLEGQYTHGLSVVHEPGLFGPATPFTFRARTRAVTIVLGLGLYVGRQRQPWNTDSAARS